MGEIVLILIGIIILTFGVVMIFDARIITKKVFSSGEINETTKIMKITGFILSLIGLGIIYMVK